MEMSSDINELAAALAKAQGEMTGAVKGSANPFFKSRFADLGSVFEALREPFARHGLSVVQAPTTAEQEGMVYVHVETMLLHASGQWMKSRLGCVVKDASPQVIGSAVSYLKRYSLQSMAGLPAVDDDGEAAQGRETTRATVTPKPDAFDEWLIDLEAVASEGTAALQAAWKAETGRAHREYLTSASPQTWERIKAKAADVTAAKKRA